jgi:hypothetical protein
MIYYLKFKFKFTNQLFNNLLFGHEWLLFWNKSIKNKKSFNIFLIMRLSLLLL